jgi:two-component system response regulator MprA
VTAEPTVLVVRPQASRLTQLDRAIRSDHHEVLTATDGFMALRTLAERDVDAIVLALDLPALDGLDVCRRLRRMGHRAPVLALDATGHPARRVRALDAGADDCLSDPFAVAELAARVRAMTRRARLDVPRQPPVVRYGDLRVDRGRRQAFRGNRELALTRTEFALLDQLAGHAGRVLSRADLMLRVWSFPAGADSNSLAVYVGYLRRKLEAGGEPRLLHTVRGVGYVVRQASMTATPSVTTTPGSTTRARSPSAAASRRNAPAGSSVWT